MLETLNCSSPVIEKAVLGCMLISSHAASLAMDSLTIEDFYTNEHKIVFQEIKEHFNTSKKNIDIVVLAERLKDKRLLEAIGGLPFLMEIVHGVENSVYIDQYCETIRKKTVVRKVSEGILESSRIIEECQDDVENALDSIRQIFFAIGTCKNLDAMPITDYLRDYTADELYKRQHDFKKFGISSVDVGIRTGYSEIDSVIGGIGESHLVVLAARPGMGKTTLAINIAQNVCKNGCAVAFFSLEMTAKQIAQKMVSSISSIPLERIKYGNVTSTEIQLLLDTAENVRKMPFIIDDNPFLKISDLRARCRRMKEKHDIKLIVIDYLQLLRTGKNTDKYTEVSEISRELKLLAKDLRTPIVSLCQLSRKVEERVGHRPILSDLRDSGSIEQDCDVIMMLLRKEYYDPYDRPGQAELIVAKNRHGSIGNVNISFDAASSRFF